MKPTQRSKAGSAASATDDTSVLLRCCVVGSIPGQAPPESKQIEDEIAKVDVQQETRDLEVSPPMRSHILEVQVSILDPVEKVKKIILNALLGPGPVGIQAGESEDPAHWRLRCTNWMDEMGDVLYEREFGDVELALRDSFSGVKNDSLLLLERGTTPVKGVLYTQVIHPIHSINSCNITLLYL